MTTPLYLKKDQERRLVAGHCWVYSNEIDVERSPLKDLQPGQAVDVVSQRGVWLGHGYVNPHALLCARLVSRQRRQPLSPALWVRRVRQALTLREQLYRRPFYRLIFGESDGLPGLTVDRYGDLLAVQITTAGMERASPEVLGALEQVVKPKTIMLRNDAPIRELEGLPASRSTVLGEAPASIEIEENDTRFEIDPNEGQKTGWYYDQAVNRAYAANLAVGKRVLDLFCYQGGWGLAAATHGAQSVVCVDSSANALQRLEENAGLNEVIDRVQCIHGDAMDTMRALKETGERFDMVVLDPPAFIKRRKDEAEGIAAYRQSNRLGLQLVERGGLLMTSSCSFHMRQETLLRVVQDAARRNRQGLQLLAVGRQGPDHPIHPAIPETGYLKTLILRVVEPF